MHFITSSILLIVVCGVISAQVNESTVIDPCTSRATCRECMQTRTCVWCAEPNRGPSRCYEPSLSFNNQNCDPDYVLNQKTKEYRDFPGIQELTRAADRIETTTGSSTPEIVQIYPQKTELFLRVGEWRRMRNFRAPFQWKLLFLADEEFSLQIRFVQAVQSADEVRKVQAR